jgi:[acyl-carrier-protein] S-malonyltransferase
LSLAITFPGQGSQSIGMLSNLAEQFTVVRSTFDQASKALGMDLWEMSQHGPDEILNKTENTQPVLLTAGVACWRVWKEQGGARPEYLAGHSLGEYTALVCANVLDLDTAVCLVNERGRYMQSAVVEGQGAMAAILGLDDERVIEICKSLSGEQNVSVANFNSPGQVVIAGHTELVNIAIDALKEAGAKRTILLTVSVPSHCILMSPVENNLSEYFQGLEFSNAEIPMIQNVDVVPRTDANEIKEALILQLRQPVRWSEIILLMKARGIQRIIECGPGKVLTGLCKRSDRDLIARAVFDVSSLEMALEEAAE